MPDLIVKNSKIDGRGVFAGRDFKKGEVVLSWHPKVLNKVEVENLPKAEKHYICPGERPGEYLLMQKPERYVNHACEPNTKSVNLSDVATKNINQGEEITTDYSLGNSLIGFQCNCKSRNCRGCVKASFYVTNYSSININNKK